MAWFTLLFGRLAEAIGVAAAEAGGNRSAADGGTGVVSNTAPREPAHASVRYGQKTAPFESQIEYG